MSRTPGMPRRLLLVGFMGAGKTTVGERLAAALGWDFLDVDRELVRRSGVSVAEFFARNGEPAFRAEEARLTARLSSRDRLVLATGGGWGGFPPGREPAGTTTVWLRVSAEEAVRRTRGDTTERPLLAGPDPIATARTLIAAREPRYRSADLAVSVDGRTPEDITREVLEWLRTSISSS